MKPQRCHRATLRLQLRNIRRATAKVVPSRRRKRGNYGFTTKICPLPNFAPVDAVPVAPTRSCHPAIDASGVIQTDCGPLVVVTVTCFEVVVPLSNTWSAGVQVVTVYGPVRLGQKFVIW